jgi:hypothetical protein
MRDFIRQWVPGNNMTSAELIKAAKPYGIQPWAVRDAMKLEGLVKTGSTGSGKNYAPTWGYPSS